MRFQDRRGVSVVRPRFHPRRRSQLRVEILEGRNLLSSITDGDFDLGTFTSPVAKGSVGLPVLSYNSSLGYGWQSKTGIVAVDRSGPDPWRRDFHTGSFGTFNVDVAPGVYDVTTTVGDQNQAHTGTYMLAEGTVLAAGVSTKVGAFVDSTARVTVTDGQFNLTIFSLGANGFALDGIKIHRVRPLNPPPPMVDAGPGQAATEGSIVSFAGAATGLGSASYAWDFGDGSGTSGTLNPQHIYQDNGTYMATLTATCGQGKFTATTQVVVANVAPTATITGVPSGATEGAPIILGSLVTDPSVIDTRAGFGESWSILKNSAPFATASGATATFTPDDDGTYTVQLMATDKDGGVSLPVVTTIKVANVAPTVTTEGTYQETAGQNVVFAATASDPGAADTAAGFIMTWDFGDGSTKVSGLGLLQPQHAYLVAGNYTVTVTATDKDGAISMPATAPATVSAATDGLTTVHLTTGWATFGEAFPEGEAVGRLQLGNLATQTDVKTTWPDGSIRFAIVSALVPAAGTYTIQSTSSSSSAGRFAPPIPIATVSLTIGGVPYTAALPRAESSDYWLNGSQVVEWRSVVTPVDPQGNPHPFLRVYFDTRAYASGQDRLDVTVENDLNVPGATAVTYDARIVAGGQTLFSQDGVNQGYLTRWRKVFDLGLTESQVTHDFGSFIDAGALPQYSSAISDQDYSTDGPTFAILGRGGNSYDYMGSTGGRPEIAPYPDWTARYLVHQTPDQAAYVMANGDLAGSWPVHIRETDGSLVSIDQKPGFWLDPRGKQYDPKQGIPLGDLSGASLGRLMPDLAHVPSLAYVPYLATGDRYYADEMGFWGNDALISSWSAPIEAGGRGGSVGIVGTEQVRARAWGLRNLEDAAAYLPDAEPAKAYLTAKVQNNLNFYDNYARTHNSPLGTILESASSNTGSILISQWQNNYLAWSLDHARDQGFRGGTLLRDEIASFQLELFTSGLDYPRDYAAPYYPTVGRILTDGTTQYFNTIGEIFIATNTNTDGTTNPPVPFNGYYGVDARLSLMIALDEGLSGAQDAYNYLVPQIATDLTQRAGWSILHKPSK